MTTDVARGRQLRLPMLDRVPELTHYPDTGCRVSPSCLRCPLEHCVHDHPQVGGGSPRPARDAEIYRIYRQQGGDIAAIARRFGLSRRTIHRAVARARCDGGEAAAAGRAPAEPSLHGVATSYPAELADAS